MMACPGWGDSMLVTIPKSTMEMVGISGSMTVSRRAFMELDIVFCIYAIEFSRIVKCNSQTVELFPGL